MTDRNLPQTDPITKKIEMLPKELSPQADAFLCQLLEGQPIFAFIQDADMRYVWTCNPTGGWVNEVIVGRKQEELPGYDATYLERLNEIKAEVLATGKDVHFEDFRPLADGRSVLTDVTYSRYQFEDGSYGIFGRLLDLTRVRPANEAMLEVQKRLHDKVMRLQASERRFNLALRDEPINIFVMDEDDRISWVANVPPPMTPESILGLRVTEIGMPAEHAQQLVDGFRRLRETGEEQRFSGWFEVAGSRYFTRMHLQPYKLGNGKLGIICKGVDETPQKMREDNLVQLNKLLHETERRFVIALEDELLTFYITDENNRYVWVHNPSPPWQPTDVIGKTDLEIGMNLRDAQNYEEYRRQVLETGEEREFTHIVSAVSGETYYKRVRLKPFTMMDGRKAVIGKDMDITSQKDLEDSLREVNRQLEQQIEFDSSQSRMEVERLTKESAGRLSHVNQISTETKNQVKRFKELAEQSREALAELNAARDMQQSMLPKGVAVPEHYELAASMETSIQVGGDYYDYLPLGSKGLVAAVGDATGHGVKAGILVAAVRSYFQLMANTHNPAKLLASVNAGIRGMQLHRTYMGLSVLNLDGKKMTYASAGMPPLMVWRADTGQVETHLIRGLFLGTEIKQTYSNLEIEVSPGDVVVCVSDGYFEARDPRGNLISALVLMDAIAVAAKQGPDTVVESLKQVRLSYTETDQLEDDATCLVIRVKE